MNRKVPPPPTSPVPGAQHLGAVSQTRRRVEERRQLLQVLPLGPVRKLLCPLIGRRATGQPVPVRRRRVGGRDPSGQRRWAGHAVTGGWVDPELLLLQLLHLVLGCLESVSTHHLLVC